MSRTLSNNTSEASQALVDYFCEENFSLVLGYTKDTNSIENSTDSYADAVANGSVAVRITAKDVAAVLTVAGQGGNRKWTPGTVPVSWSSSGDTNGQCLYEGKGGVVFMVTGFPGQKYRKDYEGSVISTEMFTDISGNFATTPDGMIEYIAINVTSTGVNTLSSKHIPIELPKNAFGKKLESSTSLSTNASNICGSGNEQLIGTCCLYYKTAEYDPVAGVTHDAGDFYMCDCTRCYRCIELAKALDKKYVFTGGTGSTGATCSCLADGQETYPTDCGPCDCTIDWNTTSDYSSILANRNYPETCGANRLATMVKNQKELSGCIVSIKTDFKGLTPDQLTLASSYESDALNNTLFFPLVGSCGKGALWPVSTVRDGVTYKYRAVGGGTPVSRGKNYTSVSLDKAAWALRFPQFPIDEIDDRVEINVMPINGFASSIPNFLPVSFVINKVVTREQIEAVTGSTDFNFFTVARLVDTNNASIYSGYAEDQESCMSLVPEFVAELVGAGTGVDEMGVKGEVIKNSSGNSNSQFTATTVEEIIPYNAISNKSGEMTVPIQTAFPDAKVGTVLTTESGRDWTVTSIASRAYGSTGVPYDATNQKIIHRGSIGNFTLNGSDAKQTIAFEVQVGALNPIIS